MKSSQKPFVAKDAQSGSTNTITQKNIFQYFQGQLPARREAVNQFLQRANHGGAENNRTGDEIEFIGEDLWRSPRLVDLPDHTKQFFPRADYALLVSPSGRSVYLLGGIQQLNYKNDIWKLRLAPKGVFWALLSQLKWWSPRKCLGVCAAYEAAAALPPDAIYVAGGAGPGGLLADVWTSTDGGLSWTCQCEKAPWGGRSDPGLVVVQGHLERLVLCGGTGLNDHGPELKADLWLSEDAGVTWFDIPAPSWDARCMPLMFSLKASQFETSSILVLGGKRLHWASDSSLHDLWHVDLDFNAKVGRWNELGSHGATSFDKAVTHSLNQQSASFYCSDLIHPRIIKVHRGQIFTSTPNPPYPWQYHGLLSSNAKTTENLLHKVGEVMRISVAPGIPHACPRLFVFGEHGAVVSSEGALAWQQAFLQQLGKGLDFSYGLPWMVWTEYVMPALLPYSMSKKRPKRADEVCVSAGKEEAAQSK